MPKVAVLMAVYNGLRWLKPQLGSIFEQYGVDVHIYASDDCSTDGSYDFLINLSEINQGLTVLPHAGKFNSAGANFFHLLKSVDFSDFDFVAFADQDDLWDANKLYHAINSISHNGVEGYSSNVMAFWPDGKENLINKAKPQQAFDYMFESAGPGCTFVMTRKLAVELQQFIYLNQEACKDVALHDWFTYAYARSHMFKWFIDEGSYMRYRQHEDNVVGANVGIKAKISRWKKMREGWYINQALLLGNILGYESEFPIKALKRYHFLDRLTLIIHVGTLRRRLRDSIALALFFLVMKRK